MADEITRDHARAALEAVAHGRRRIIEQIDLPRWYYWSLAIGWVVLGVLSDLNHWWLTSSATLVFGAVHSTIAPHVTSGRRGRRDLSVQADVAGRQIPRYVALALIALVGVTVAASLAIAADGAQHPTTIASVFVALAIVLGGPLLLQWVRRRVATGPTAGA